MNVRSRRQAVLEDLKETGVVNINELAARLSVSSMTIRRDLRRLAEQGLVTLVREGAILNSGAASLYNLTLREKKEQTEKGRIGRYCADLIKEGNAVFIDCGSTAKAIAEAITTKKNIVVLTNSLPVMNILGNNKNIRLISVPGVYVEANQGFWGELASEFLRRFKLDIVFIGAWAIDVESGIMTPDVSAAQTESVLLKQGRKTVVVIDHTKLGTSALIQIGEFDDIDLIVTDRNADEKILAEIRSKGVEISLV
ncbi:MAG: DeoR/GlpR family DNA-binding transcription regulator [Selenomonadaceae bacterium]